MAISMTEKHELSGQVKLINERSIEQIKTQLSGIRERMREELLSPIEKEYGEWKELHQTQIDLERKERELSALIREKLKVNENFFKTGSWNDWNASFPQFCKRLMGEIEVLFDRKLENEPAGEPIQQVKKASEKVKRELFLISERGELRILWDEYEALIDRLTKPNG